MSDFSLENMRQQLRATSEIGKLLSLSDADQVARGYGHTLREICQQPATWADAATSGATHAVAAEALKKLGVVGRPSGSSRHDAAVVFTGSGSSHYVGECAAIAIQESLGVATTALPGGLLLTHAKGALPPVEKLLLVSIARSGNSPESVAVVDVVSQVAPQARHLVLTCNAEGELAKRFANHPQASVALLDPRTNDRSLVMTSSFTNLVLAGLALSCPSDLADWQNRLRQLAGAAQQILLQHADALAGVARRAFRSAIYLGSGCRLGSAHEGALKMLEMTGGRIDTMAESFLGFRHGPMSATQDDTLIVAFLSSDRVTRAYELDLLAELDRKELGKNRIVAGYDLPKSVATEGTITIDYAASQPLADGDQTVLDALVAQLLGFFRSMHEGFHPDSPSQRGIINRVVEPFRIHR